MPARQPLASLLGWRQDTTSNAEKLAAAGGTFLSLVVIWAVTALIMGPDFNVWVVSSTGASAVLVFSVPHGPMSQPWPVIGGQLLSSLIGVTCFYLLPDHAISWAFGVLLALLAMHYCRCMHPPGAATVLTFTLGGAEIHDLGYQFLLTPVALNVFLIVLLAWLLSLPFDWRRYPQALGKRSAPPANSALAPEDLHHALSKLDSYVDIDFDELLRILQLAGEHANDRLPGADDLLIGACYSNARSDQQWEIRRVLGIERIGRRQRLRVRYQVEDGVRKGQSGECLMSEMLDWCHYAVQRTARGWARCTPRESQSTTGGQCFD